MNSPKKANLDIVQTIIFYMGIKKCSTPHSLFISEITIQLILKES